MKRKIQGLVICEKLRDSDVGKVQISPERLQDHSLDIFVQAHNFRALSWLLLS